MDCTTSGEKGQLQEAPAHLLLVIQTSAICHFDQQNDICPSGYINQPKLAGQKSAIQHCKKKKTSLPVVIQTCKLYQNDCLIYK